MKRRDFITILGGAVAAWPLSARAQHTTPVIGYLSNRSVAAEAPLREPFLKSVEEAGFVVGQNIAVDYRHSQGRDDELSGLATELVRRQVAILVATDNASALAAKAATSTIPIVFGAATIRSNSASWQALINRAVTPPASMCSRPDWAPSAWDCSALSCPRPD
jgi:putative ABC transport system substrate-binding protein